MTDVVMPQMGESIVEGTLTRWLKKPGDRVERDEPLFEISTDKVDTEIPSPSEGVLSEVLVQEGATVAINAVVARIGDGAKTAEAPKQQSPAPAAQPAAAPRPEGAPRPEEKAEPQPKPAAPPAAPPQTPSATAPVPAEQAERLSEHGPLSPAGSQDGPRIQYRSGERERHRRRRPHYQAGRGIIHVLAGCAYLRERTRPSQPAAAQPAAPLPLAESAKTRTEPMSICGRRSPSTW